MVFGVENWRVLGEQPDGFVKLVFLLEGGLVRLSRTDVLPNHIKVFEVFFRNDVLDIASDKLVFAVAESGEELLVGRHKVTFGVDLGLQHSFVYGGENTRHLSLTFLCLVACGLHIVHSLAELSLTKHKLVRFFLRLLKQVGGAGVDTER